MAGEVVIFSGASRMVETTADLTQRGPDPIKNRLGEQPDTNDQDHQRSQPQNLGPGESLGGKFTMLAVFVFVVVRVVLARVMRFMGLAHTGS